LNNQSLSIIFSLFMTIVEFVGQLFFQHDIFKLQEVFSEHGIRVNLEIGLGNFQYFTDLRQLRGAKKIPKIVLKTRFTTKETTYTLVFGKYLVIFFRSHSIMAFSVFLEDSLTTISVSHEPDVLRKI
jgi:hypothetical protein